MSDNDLDLSSAAHETEKNSPRNEDPVLEKIQFTAASQNPFLNISQLKLKEIPEELLNSTHLQFLYVAFNSLLELPEDFFSALPNIKWLDLRGNRLQSLPTVDLGCHAFLEYLLIEDNCISHLPMELGYVRSLRGIALSGNPLDFPHAEIVSAGTQSVKAYLREVHEGRREIENRLAAEEDTADDWEADEAAAPPSDVELLGPPNRQLPGQRPPHHLQSMPEAESAEESAAPPPPLSTQTAPLHRHAAPQIRQRVAAAAAPQKQQRRLPARQSERHSQLVRQFPEPPAPGLIERRAAEERRNARRRDTLSRQEAVLQRRRDAEASRQWREESRKLQMSRAREQLLKGPLTVARESEGRIRGAPFNAGWESELMQLPSQADVERQRWEGGGVRPEAPPEPLSAEEQTALERRRRQREAEIAQQVQQHTAALMERRQRMLLEAGGGEGRQQQQQQERMTAAQAVEAAKRDVEIAMRLQRELAFRRAELENRTLALASGGGVGGSTKAARKEQK